ncbi:MAG: type IV secretion system DNA-binding domain-containing protein [Firmicutes bacterium]|nr:type IV secretion system DNA-binding domain-containing protein [Bacillota bacterium]
MASILKPLNLPTTAATPTPQDARHWQRLGRAIVGAGVLLGGVWWALDLLSPLHPVALWLVLIGGLSWTVGLVWLSRHPGWMTWRGRWELALWGWILVGGSLGLVLYNLFAPLLVHVVARLAYPEWVTLLMPRHSWWYTPVGYGRQSLVFGTLLFGAFGSLWAQLGYGPQGWWATADGGSPDYRPVPDGTDLIIAHDKGNGYPVVIPGRDRPLHMTVVGPTGGGKSVELHALAQQDLARPDIGLIVVEPKGDLLKEPVGPDQTPGIWPLATAYLARHNRPAWLVDPARASSAVLNPLDGDPATAAEGLAWLYMILQKRSGKTEGFFSTVNQQYLTNLVGLVHLLEPERPRWATLAALMRDESLLFQALISVAELYGLDREEARRPGSSPAFIAPRWQEPRERPGAKPPSQSAPVGDIAQVTLDLVRQQQEEAILASLGGKIERPGRLTADFVARAPRLPRHTEACLSYWLTEYWIPGSKQREWATGARAQLADFFNHPDLMRVLDAAPGRDVVDLDAVFDAPGVLCISLAQGTIGPRLASAFGVLVTTQLDAAIKRRKDRQEEARAHGQDVKLSLVHIILDEFGSYVSQNFGDVLAQARSYNVQCTLAYQAQSQIADTWGPNFVNSMTTNTRHKLVYGGLAKDDVAFWQGQFGFHDVEESKSTMTRHHSGASWEPTAVNVAQQSGVKEEAMIDFNTLRYLPASEVAYQLTVSRSLQPPGVGKVHAVTWADIHDVEAPPGPMAPDLPASPTHLITPDPEHRMRILRRMGIGLSSAVEEEQPPEPPLGFTAPVSTSTPPPDRPSYVTGLEADGAPSSPRVRLDWDTVAVNPIEAEDEAPDVAEPTEPAPFSPWSLITHTPREENDDE